MNRRFRGKELKITVSNPEHVEKGVKQLILNGKRLEENYIPAGVLTEINEIELIMGK
jgi:cellobiose phosphorylase